MTSQLNLVGDEDKQVGEGGTMGGVDGSNNWDRCQSTLELQGDKNPIFDKSEIRVYES